MVPDVNETCKYSRTYPSSAQLSDLRRSYIGLHLLAVLATMPGYTPEYVDLKNPSTIHAHTPRLRLKEGDLSDELHHHGKSEPDP